MLLEKNRTEILIEITNKLGRKNDIVKLSLLQEETTVKLSTVRPLLTPSNAFHLPEPE